MAAADARDTYNLKALRDFLIEVYSPEEFWALVAYDEELGPLRHEFSRNSAILDMVDEAIGYCERRGLLEKLLALVEKERPGRWAELSPRLFLGTAAGEHASIYSTLEGTTYGRLPSTHVRYFGALIADKTHGFVGREFVFDALDRFLEENRSGYYLIEGEPGIGKTALVAQLVKTRGYAHHFNVAPQNIRTPRQFLANACAQVIARYGLAHHVLPEGATEDSGFLTQCLAEAAADPANRPVVLLVDALDESDRLGIPAQGAALHLPPALPEGAFIVVTSRPLHDPHLPPANLCSLFLEPGSDGNLLDIRAYIEERLQGSDELRASLARRHVTEESFTEELVQKSEGNFIYLRYVLPAFAEGRLDELPRGLTAYYQAHWRGMQKAEPDEFKELYVPIVSTLAVVHEPVTVELLCKWTGFDAARIKTAIGLWREFLEEDRTSGKKKYRVYHTSFRDFLEELL